LYDSGRTGNGDLATAGGFPGNGRAGADAICAASPNRPAGAEYTNFRAFISVTAADEIRDMPINYGVPTGLPIVGGDETTQLAPNWASLLDGNIDATLQAAGSGGTVFHWTGSTALGAIDTVNDHCMGWTSAGLLGGGIGRDDATVQMVGGLGTSLCSSNMDLLCVAF
jgi:hypothetical protein